jgi:hypothetical protein
MSSTMVSADHHRELIDTKDARIRELENKILDQNATINRESQDCSVLLNVAQYFVVRAIERGDYQQIRDALREAKDDTGLYAGDIADMIERLGLCSRDMMISDYEVTITVPVTLTVSVEATDEDAAEEAAKEEIESNGIDNYTLDVDWYNMDTYEINEV